MYTWPLCLLQPYKLTTLQLLKKNPIQGIKYQEIKLPIFQQLHIDQSFN